MQVLRLQLFRGPCFWIWAFTIPIYNSDVCRLLPGVEDVAQNVADPECRSVASKAHATLLKVGADGKVTGIVANEAEVLAQLGSAVANVGGQVGEVVVKYVASLLCGLINASKYKEDQWIEVCHDNILFLTFSAIEGFLQSKLFWSLLFIV